MNLEQQLSSILGDPEAMSKIASVAESLGLGGSAPPAPAAPPVPTETEKPLPLTGLVPANDDRTKLLMALKPFLSEKRAPYVDAAVTVVRLIGLGKAAGALEPLLGALGFGNKAQGGKQKP